MLAWYALVEDDEQKCQWVKRKKRSAKKKYLASEANKATKDSFCNDKQACLEKMAEKTEHAAANGGKDYSWKVRKAFKNSKWQEKASNFWT